MTAKEKAIVLIDMFFEYTNDADKYEYAQKCALIAVDEVLNELDLQNHLLRSYWYDVKHEIEKL